MFYKVDMSNNKEVWTHEGRLHREGGLPAVTTPEGTKEYWVSGKRHRESGPAIEGVFSNDEYWVNGEEYTQFQFENRQGCVIESMTVAGEVLWKINDDPAALSDVLRLVNSYRDKNSGSTY